MTTVDPADPECMDILGTLFLASKVCQECGERYESEPFTREADALAWLKQDHHLCPRMAERQAMTNAEYNRILQLVESKVQMRIQNILHNQVCKPSMRTSAFLYLMHAVHESLDDVQREYVRSQTVGARAITIRE